MQARDLGYVTLATLALSLGLNVILGLHVARIADANPSPAPTFRLKSGDHVPPLVSKNLDGRTVTIRYDDGKPTLLYVVSPTCLWCERNEPNFDAIVTQKADHYNIVLLSVVEKGANEYAAKISSQWNNRPVTVLKGVSPELKQQMHLDATPQTIAIESGGRVSAAWLGAYTGTTKGEVQSALNVELPGVAASRVALVQCTSQDGGVYSRGAIITEKGRRVQCAADGKWVAPTR